MVLSSAIVCDHDRRIADDRRSSFHLIADDRRPYWDLRRSAICDPRSYGNQPLDRTWFYLLRSSAITIAGSQTIADLIAICDLRSAIIWKPALKLLFSDLLVVVVVSAGPNDNEKDTCKYNFISFMLPHDYFNSFNVYRNGYDYAEIKMPLLRR